MTTHEPIPETSARTDPFRWSRADAAELLQRLRDEGFSSQRAFARQHDVPRSTLGRWQRRRQHLAAPAELVAFFESPVGLLFLQGLVLAAHLVFHQSGAVGLRVLMLFFRLAGLAPFLACSFGAQQRLANRLQGLTLAYRQQQPQRLAKTMPARSISLCEDETFHTARTCLVAIEPVSNFIVVEQYQARRDGATWTAVVGQALQDWPVEVIQVSSDEARGIKAHVREALAAHHSPDLMHMQADLHRATSLPLRRHVEQAQEQVNQAEYQGVLAYWERNEWLAGPHGPGRPPDFEGRLQACKACVRQADEQLAAAVQTRQQVKQAIRGIGDDYHPFDASDARAMTPEALRGRLQARLAVIDEAAEQMGLAESGQKRIERVKRLLPRLVGTLAWFWLQVRQAVGQQGWTEARQELFVEVLAWAYWQRASGRGRDAEQRRQRRELAGRCWAAVEASVVWQNLEEKEQQRMKVLACELAGRWVRSSSCVEGRNGWLRHRHHGRQGLSEKSLAVLTVLHNYLSTRADGTTAAERFFGQKPDDLFAWLLARAPELPRPAKPRQKAA